MDGKRCGSPTDARMTDFADRLLAQPTPCGRSHHCSVEAFSSMQADLDKERKAIMKQWAKREEQIERVMNVTVGMYGDLQGIVGKSLQEFEGLSLAALAGPDEDNQGGETL